MDDLLEQIINESIAIESNVAELYSLFYRIFPEDKDFWWDLVKEEKNHSFLLEGAKKALFSANKFPRPLVSDSLEPLIEANKNLRKMIDDFLLHPPPREIALNAALKAETCAGEAHFQQAMTLEEGSEILKILQRINSDDKNHEEKIRAYMKANDLKIL